MYRRSFLKAMGLTGLLLPANWRTLLSGPVPGGSEIHKGILRKYRRITIFAIAGSDIKRGMIVTRDRNDSRIVYPAQPADMDRLFGVADVDAEARQPVEVVIQGPCTCRTTVPRHVIQRNKATRRRVAAARRTEEECEGEYK